MYFFPGTHAPLAYYRLVEKILHDQLQSKDGPMESHLPYRGSSQRYQRLELSDQEKELERRADFLPATGFSQASKQGHLGVAWTAKSRPLLRGAHISVHIPHERKDLTGKTGEQNTDSEIEAEDENASGKTTPEPEADAAASTINVGETTPSPVPEVKSLSASAISSASSGSSEGESRGKGSSESL